MDIEVEEKGPFKVIGIVECGRAEDGNDWVPELWSTVFERIEEISHIIKADKTKEAWSLMSGIESYL